MRRLFVLAALAITFWPAAVRAQFDDPMLPWLRRLLEANVDEERVTFRSDFLYWYLAKLPVPPLVTTGPAGSQAVVGEPGTEILRGGELTSRHGRYVGGRLGGEAWLVRGSPWGLETSATILERDSSNITFPWGSITPLARPFRDPATSVWRSFIVAGDSPQFGPLTGSVNVYSRIEFFEQDVNLMLRLYQGEMYRLSLLAGAHFIQMRERLDITSTSRILPDQTTLIGVTDHFQTFDKFYGGQVGLSGAWRWRRLVLEGKGVIALGGDDQLIRTKGDRVFQTPLARTTENFGLYVLPGNTGSFERGALDLVTEWGVNIAWLISSRFDVRFGYTLLTWNNPVRPGDQIEPLRIPFRTDFSWAQGMNFGVEVRW